MLGFNQKIRKAKQSTTRETFNVYQIFRPKGQDPFSMNPQIPHPTEFLSLPLYIPLSAQPYCSCLHIPSTGINCVTPKHWN